MATAKLFLDLRYANKDAGEKPATIKIAINHRGKSAALPTTIRVLPSQWDKKNSKVVSHDNRSKLNRVLLERLSAVTSVMDDMAATRDLSVLSASDLAKAVKEALNPHVEEVVPPKPNKPKENPDAVCKFFERYIERKCRRDTTKGLYRCTWRRIEDFLGKKKAAKLEFSEINLRWIEDFDAFLAVTAPKPNGRRPHLSNLKAVINYAIDNEVIERNPFRRFTIKTNTTEPRALTLDELKMIIFAELPEWMHKYRDFFVLSFLMRGTNTVDLCHMPTPVDGRVRWARSKTDIKFEVKIEPEAQKIIEKYKGDGLMLNICDTGRPYRYFDGKCNKALHKMRDYINANRRGGVEVPEFTMYSARHTWATIASYIDVPFDTISVGLAHAIGDVTERYIKRDPAKIDQANRRVLDYVLYGKDYRVPEPLVVPQAKKRGRPRKSA